MSAAESTAERERLEAQEAQLQKDLAALERQWRFMPWLGLGLLACIPAGWIWGKAGVIVALVIVGYIVGTSVYITYGNLQRVRQRLDDLHRRRKRQRRKRAAE